MHKTIAVIGHVDHGKTALVKALTGTDTDRLEEERKRGLSIVLGFANQQASEGWLHFIDTPGHADFIQTAAAGLSGADAILLVVDSSEGPSHQTVEHLKLAKLFGIRDAVVAFSKSDIDHNASSENTPRAIAELLREHGFDASPIIRCSSRTMEGIDRLAAALKDLFGSEGQSSSPDRAFLPIDRAFSAEGAGTIVTGTLLGGELSLDDAVTIQPMETACSVRGLQIAGQTAEKATVGARVAVNLRGIKSQDIRRGDVLCAPGQGQPSCLFDVMINAPDEGTRRLSHMESVTVLHGTRRSPARVRILGTSEQDATIAQLEFENDQIGFVGQRFILRRPASSQTICGGQVLDAEAVLAKRNKELYVAVLRAAANSDVLAIAKGISERDQGSVDLALLSRLARKTIDNCSAIIRRDFIIDGARIAHSIAEIDSVKARLVETMRAFHKDRPLRPHAPSPGSSAAFKHVPRELLIYAVRSLVDKNEIEERLDGMSIVGHDPNEHLGPAQRELYQDAIEQLRRTSLMPELLLDPTSLEIEHADLIDLMVWNGEAVRLYNHALSQTVILQSEVVAGAITSLQRAFPGGQTFKTGEARAALSTNRKTIVPLLEHLDAQGITIRDGNVRVIKVAETRE
ncbi:MAG: selenocysteine-specific translation elongation factor [Henriciella sp.]|nr:selenocysteine-specific translation elongation factor [Henriciella sp.]